MPVGLEIDKVLQLLSADTRAHSNALLWELNNTGVALVLDQVQFAILVPGQH